MGAGGAEGAKGEVLRIGARGAAALVNGGLGRTRKAARGGATGARGAGCGKRGGVRPGSRGRGAGGNAERGSGGAGEGTEIG